jgi:hypothetical protein
MEILSQNKLPFVCMQNVFIIRDFVVEAIREKILVFDYQITEGDYISFYRRKLDLHPEMDTITELTEKKIKNR